MNPSQWWRQSKPAPQPFRDDYRSGQDVRESAREARNRTLIDLGRGSEVKRDDPDAPDPRRTWPIDHRPAPAPGQWALDDEQVAIAGAWHGNLEWAANIIPAITAAQPGIRTILHTGNIGTWPGALGRTFLSGIDRICNDAGVERILLTPGAHEDWPRITAGFLRRPHEPLQMSQTVWALPRGHRMTIGGRTFMSFGGAASLDKRYRIEGVSWWQEEMPTEADVAHALAGGAADVLISHDAVDGGIPEIDDLLSLPNGWGMDANSAAATSRSRVTAVWKALRPKILFHGHPLTAAGSPAGATNQVVSLLFDEQRRNMVIVEIPSLKWRWLEPCQFGRSIGLARRCCGIR